MFVRGCGSKHDRLDMDQSPDRLKRNISLHGNTYNVLFFYKAKCTLSASVSRVM